MSQIRGQQGVGPEGGHQLPERDRRRDARLVLIGIAAALLIWFAVENLQTVEIHFWVASARVSQITVIIISVLLGVIIAWLVSRLRRQAREGRTAGDGMPHGGKQSRAERKAAKAQAR